MNDPKFIYKSEKPYTEDLNDMVEADLEKGRGPDKQKRKTKVSGTNPVPMTSASYGHNYKQEPSRDSKVATGLAEAHREMASILRNDDRKIDSKKKS